jgi:hypothetical protein
VALCPEPTGLFLAAKLTQVFLRHPERHRQPAEVQHLRLRQRHDEDVARAAILVLLAELTQQETAHEHARSVLPNHDDTVLREPVDFVRRLRRRFLQRQGQSFHRRQDIRQLSEIPKLIDLRSNRVNPRHQIDSRAPE